ncbi:hypothetical protein LZP73_06260 [Shewanella sp. AS16]|uniref:hypothetical protein n=1 Tax=Shewanella sp. AS16 TaxID=2907625 RepID=UPI001F206903|nr:hypothetical protein [Shewanella sp. AS16]MCE9685820.1 hypothetical protein [Shewanella sp. AS16]
MKKLTVSVLGSRAESRLLTLPVDVYASDGSMLASGTASPNEPGRFELFERQDQQLDRVHVLSKLPSGFLLQQTIDLQGDSAEVMLNASEMSPHEWLQWVTPFHSIGHLRTNAESVGVESRRIGKVWMTLWALREGNWEASRVKPIDRRSDHGIQQFVLDIPNSPHLLQVGGEEVAWRLVSLPPGGGVRVAMTRSAAVQGDVLDITVGRTEPENELIMSYLARGAVSEAERLAEAWNAADLLLYEKRHDPVSAAAGAYFLLKNQRLLDRRDWVRNLVEWFPYMADGAIVSAALKLQQENASEREIRSLIDLALGRGLPIFAIGASILVETMAAVHRGKRETKRFHSAYLAAQAYARALCSRGAYFTFYGKSPAEPSWTPIYGNEGEPIDHRSSAMKTDDTVIYSRPIGGIQSGRFGSTQVALPRRPVSHMVDTKPGIKPESVDTSKREKRKLSEGMRTNVIVGISRKRSYAGMENNTEPRIGSLVRSNVTADKSVSVKATQKRTPHYWLKERLNNAFTIFDGDE